MNIFRRVYSLFRDSKQVAKKEFGYVTIYTSDPRFSVKFSPCEWKELVEWVAATNGNASYEKKE